MNKTLSTTAVAALLLALAGPAFSQATDLTGITDLDDEIDDLSEDIVDDLDEGDDPLRYSISGVPQGLAGSLALQAQGTSGNSDASDVLLAGRLTYGAGEWSHLFGIALQYGDGTDSDGDDNDKERFFTTYEGLRAIGPRVFAFGTGRFEYDGNASTERDAFLGVGLGYRILTDQNQTWRVQAAPGVRYTDLAIGEDDTEFAGIVSSRYYFRFSDQVALTNDTDVLASDQNTLVTNDLGVNYRMTNTLSTRVSYRIEYDSDPSPTFDNTDSTFGVSLVVGF